MKHAFKKYYKFPLYEDCDIIFTKDDGIALNIKASLSQDVKDQIIEVLNGWRKANDKNKFIFDPDRGEVILNDKTVFVVRGWGHLIGRGGFNLAEEKAIEIYNQFGEFIARKLSGLE